MVIPPAETAGTGLRTVRRECYLPLFEKFSVSHQHSHVQRQYSLWNQRQFQVIGPHLPVV